MPLEALGEKKHPTSRNALCQRLIVKDHILRKNYLKLLIEEIR
jgi:hypothetical protein